MKGWKKLNSLNLAGTQITDAGLEHVKEMKGLQRLDVRHTKVTDEGVRKLQQALPNLTISDKHANRY